MLERWKQWRIKYWQGANSPLYGLLFLAIWGGLLIGYRDALEWGDESWVFLVAAMVAVSGGATLAINIFWEVVGSMLQLIPKVREGIRAEGKVEGAAEERQKWTAWLARRETAERAGLPFDEPPPG